jgi:hypothetical protein
MDALAACHAHFFAQIDRAITRKVDRMAGKMTPGSWVVEIDPMDDSEARTLVMPKGEDIGGKWIALAQYANEDRDIGCTLSEAEANARAIAAIPDMLAALKLAEPILAGCDSSGMSCGRELAAVRAAIAMADSRG